MSAAVKLRQRMVPAAWVDQYSAWLPENGDVA